LERLIAQEENAISILIGEYPEGLRRGLALIEQPLPPEVPPGLPSALMERRPDIREAEQLLVATNANASGKTESFREHSHSSRQEVAQPRECPAAVP